MGKRNSGPGDVEVYTDAGNRSGVGAWACLAFRKDGRGGEFERSGALRGYLENSDVCETRAIANALHALFVAGMIDKGDLVVVRCDNLNVCRRINDPRVFPRRKKTRASWEGADWIGSYAKKRGFRVHCRHVAGHQPLTSTDPYAPGNRRVDHACSQILNSGAKPRPAVGATSRAARIKNTVAKLSGR